MALPYPTKQALTGAPTDITGALSMVDGKTYQMQNNSGHDIFVTEAADGTTPTQASDSFVIASGQTVDYKQVSGRNLWAWASGLASAASLTMGEQAG